MDTQFDFTLIDRELIGDTHLSDPLATMSLWSHFGRLIIPNLTEQTNNLQGFHMVCLNFYLYNSYLISEPGGEKIIGITDFYKTAEQIFAYAYFKNTHEWKLPGKNRLTRFFDLIEKNSVTITKEKNRELLGNQIANGTWGLYRGAAIRSKILTENGQVLHPFFAEEFLAYYKKVEFKHERAFITAIKEVYKSENGYDLNLSHKWVQEVADLFKNISPFKKLYKDYLILNQGLAEFASHLYSFGDFSNEKKRSLAHSLIRAFPEKKSVLQDIIKCEDLIGTLNSVFSFIYSKTKEDMDKIASCLEKLLSIEDLINSFIAFENIEHKPTLGIAYEAYKILCEDREVTNHRGLLEWIINKHTQICEIRRSSPWLEYENNKLIVYEELNASEVLNVVPGKGWMHDYYLSPLKNIYKSLK